MLTLKDSRSTSDLIDQLSSAKIAWPSVQQAQTWARQVENYEPHIHGCFAVADGKLIPLEANSRYSQQNYITME